MLRGWTFTPKYWVECFSKFMIYGTSWAREYAQRDRHPLWTIPPILKPLLKGCFQILTRLEICTQGLPIILSVLEFPEKHSGMEICMQEAYQLVSLGTPSVRDGGKQDSRGRNWTVAYTQWKPQTIPQGLWSWNGPADLSRIEVNKEVLPLYLHNDQVWRERV